MTLEKVPLGKKLFFDPILSVTGKQSCSSCHHRSFTDANTAPRGATGIEGRRNAMSLANVACAARLTWAEPGQTTLEEQVLVPLGETKPIEMGMHLRQSEILAALDADKDYSAAFQRAFPEDAEPVSVLNIAKAIESFQRTLISGNSAFDRYQRGDSNALSESAKQRMALFFSPRSGSMNSTISSSGDPKNVQEPGTLENFGSSVFISYQRPLGWVRRERSTIEQGKFDSNM